MKFSLQTALAAESPRFAKGILVDGSVELFTRSAKARRRPVAKSLQAFART